MNLAVPIQINPMLPNTPDSITARNRLLAYDAERRRVWIRGQRIHHGMTGALVAGTGLLSYAMRRVAPKSGLELTLLGTMLMAHDWKDRSIWFQRGHQDQP